MSKQQSSSTLPDFFSELLQDVYHAEKILEKCFTALSIAAFTDELKSALAAPSTESAAHLDRLKLIFDLQKIKPGKKDNDIITALTAKAYELIKKNEAGTAGRDAGIIYAAQLMEHYKLASYQVLHTMAIELKLDQEAALLDQCLAEEKNTSAYLSQIAQNIVHPLANT